MTSEQEYTIFDLNNQFLKEPCVKWDFDMKTSKDSIDFSNSLNMTREYLKGIGLAANQVGFNYNVFSVKGFDSCFFNPKIVSSSDEMIVLEEGCLSFPGLIVKIKRPKAIKLRFADVTGNVETKNYAGMTARIIQHEMDHLNGELFYNKASLFHREQAFRKWKR